MADLPSEKAAARSKFRSTQALKRAHGSRGRGRGGGGARPAARAAPELDSNADRYAASDEDAGSGDDGAAPSRRSEGADLSVLLAEGEQFFAQAHYRYRSFADAGADVVPPPVDVAALEAELAVDAGALLAALQQLPLGRVLGLEPEYLLDLGLSLQQSAAAAAAAADAAAAAVDAPRQQQQPAPAPAPAPVHAPAAVAQRGPPQAAAAAAPAAGSAAAAALRTSCGGGGDDDDVLQQLLAASGGGPEAAAPRSGAAPSSSARLPPHLQPRQPAPAPAPRAPAPAAAAAAAGDDELDELLSLCGAAAPAPGAPQAADAAAAAPAPRGAAAGGSKKQSLEAWLDGF
ncbi:hypothetical protein HT031_002021 [Scenedesmus sp. PABB004]|nr:hypothetical protein HT031_002021 [Scenedesmus sp. PABB004]